jgi:hypothetical protein
MLAQYTYPHNYPDNNKSCCNIHLKVLQLAKLSFMTNMCSMSKDIKRAAT